MYENSITSCKYYSFGNTSAKKKLVYILGRVWELNGRFSTDTR